ncbi:hypothetical protein CHUAL_003493 [Chamberlinius hualienensis]
MQYLRIFVISCRNLLQIKGSNQFGCYVTAELGGKTKSTATQDETVCIWNEVLDFNVDKNIQPESTIFFTVKRASCLPIRIKDRVIAWTEVTLKNAIEAARSKSQMYEAGLSDKYNRQTHGILQLKFHIDDPFSIEATNIIESGYFIIDVFRAEGLPRMDLGNIFSHKLTHTKLVDSYLVITFADEKVTTSVIKQESNPVWNERLYLPFNLPLQSNYIKFELKDEDILTQDDLVATSQLAMKDITPQWENVCHLPCFGPSFINFYGASRKFRLITTKEMYRMNTGQDEGCAFRGRVLLSITTQLGKVPDETDASIPQTVISQSLPCNEGKCQLRVTLMDCFLLRSSKITTLEVSMGLFGDSKIENSNYIRSSCVKSFVPVANIENIGQFYAPLPASQKPVITFELALQGNIQRLFRHNCYKYIIQIMENYTEKISINTNGGLNLKEFQNFRNSFSAVSKRLKSFVFTYEMDTELDRYFHEILLNTINLSEEKLNQISEKWRSSIDESQTLSQHLVATCSEILEHLKSCIPTETVNEYPDVYFWLFSNWKKISYCRISIPDILFSEITEFKGKFCDVTRDWNLKFSHEIGPSIDYRQPGIIRAAVWFGEESQIHNCFIWNGNAYYQINDETIRDSKWIKRWTKLTRLDRHRPKKLLYDNETNVKIKKQKDIQNLSIVPIKLNGENIEFGSVKNFEENSSESNMQQPLQQQISTSTKTKSLLSTSDKHKSKGSVFHFSSPNLQLQFLESYLFELRCYLYQAKQLLSGDRTGFSDPFARISFLSYTTQSHYISESLCPTWEETIILPNITLPGTLNFWLTFPSPIIIEIYDKDNKGAEEYLGYCELYPIMVSSQNRNLELFQWHAIKMGTVSAGELLAFAELINTEEESYKRIDFNATKETIPIPIEIRPKHQQTSLQILCIGLRLNNDSSYGLHRPSIEIYYNKPEPIANTDEIENFPNESNFKSNYFKLELSLPMQIKFLPALTMRLKQRQLFDIMVIAGVGIVTELDQFFVTEEMWSIHTSDKSELPNEPIANANVSIKVYEEIKDLDWWSKYYASKGENDKCANFTSLGFLPIQILPNALEEEEVFKHAIKKIKSYPIYRGKSLPGVESSRELVAHLKLCLQIQPATETAEPSFTSLMAERLLTMSGQYQLRLYLVRAYNLPIKDFRSSDPYVRVKIGDREAEVPDSVRQNSINPIFGCLYETTINWPKDVEILIDVMDKDLLSGDDLIGSTLINIDERLLAPCWALCGVAPQYMTCGPYVWRDYKLPSEILNYICSLNSISIRKSGQQIIVGDTEFSLSQSETQQIAETQNIVGGNWEEVLALKALQRLNLVVKEHVETRPLYNSSQPGIQQGQLEMWLDIIPIIDNLVTNAVDIVPRKPKSYELRCVIYNVYDVILDDRNLIGDRMTDVYVKGWLMGLESKSQKTDIHHRSFDGEGNFNWRLVFQFQFLHGENVLVHRSRKNLLDVYLTDMTAPLTLCLQICDYDNFSRDDILGTMTLDLMTLPSPRKTRLSKSPNRPLSNIFKLKKTNRFNSKFHYDFMPLAETPPTDTPFINMFVQKWGEIEMEIELLSEEDAKLKPAGIGRDEPNANPHLIAPVRPSTSFHWLTSPLKFLKYICCEKLRTEIIITVIVIILGATLYVLFRTYLEEKIRHHFVRTTH